VNTAWKFIKMFFFPAAFTWLAVLDFRASGVDSPWFWFEVAFVVATLYWDGAAAWLWSLVRPKPLLVLEASELDLDPHEPGSKPGDCSLCKAIAELRKEKGSSG
jgi:hypothetical protein